MGTDHQAPENQQLNRQPPVRPDQVDRAPSRSWSQPVCAGEVFAPALQNYRSK